MPFRRVRGLRVAGLLAAILVMVVAGQWAAVASSGVSLRSPGSPTDQSATTSPPGCAQPLIISAYSQIQIDELIADKSAGYFCSQYVIDMVSGNDNSTVSLSNLQTWSQNVLDRFPSFTAAANLFCQTAGLTNVNTIVEDLNPTHGCGTILYDYEPGYEPEFSWNFTTTLHNMGKFSTDVTTNAKYGTFSAWGYPTGRPVLEKDLEPYNWDYARLISPIGGYADHPVDQAIQTQRYASSPTNWSLAIEKLITQYKGEGIPISHLVVQVTLGTTGNGVSASTAYSDYTALVRDLGGKLPTYFYVWWSSNSVLTAFLQKMGR